MRPFTTATRLGVPFIIAAVLFSAAACGGDSTSGPTIAPATSSPAGSATGATNPLPTVVPATATSTTAATATTPATASTTPPPTPRPTKPAGEGPRVLWMLSDHGGAGALIFRFETDVPTTATLRAVGSVGGPPPLIEPQSDTKLTTVHTISAPAGSTPVYWAVDVVDAAGRTGTGLLERGEVIGNQYWGRKEHAPKVTMGGNRKATVTWTNLHGGGTPPPGTVQLFAKRATCTTADACVPQHVQTFGGDIPGTDPVATNHRIAIAFPADTTSNYQVLLTGGVVPVNNGTVLAHFYQVDLRNTDVR